MLSQLVRLKKCSKGQSLVEFALLLPIILLLMMGIVQFGIIFNAQVQITSAAREGVRLASVGGSPGQVRMLIENVTEGTLCLELEEVILEVKGENENDEGEGENENDEGEGEEVYSPSRGSELTVTIQAKVEVIVPLMGFIFPDSGFPISAEASMRYQRFK